MAISLTKIEKINLSKEAEQEITTLRILCEKYLSTTIIREDVFGYLHSLPIANIHREISVKTGKNSNTSYKDINNNTTVNVISFFRYWKALKDLAIEKGIPVEKIPTMDSLLDKYECEINYINGLIFVSSVNDYTAENTEFTIKLVNHFLRSQSNLCKKQSELLFKLTNEYKVATHFKESQRQRMSKV